MASLDYDRRFDTVPYWANLSRSPRLSPSARMGRKLWIANRISTDGYRRVQDFQLAEETSRLFLQIEANRCQFIVDLIDAFWQVDEITLGEDDIAVSWWMRRHWQRAIAAARRGDESALLRQCEFADRELMGIYQYALLQNMAERQRHLLNAQYETLKQSHKALIHLKQFEHKSS